MRFCSLPTRLLFRAPPPRRRVVSLPDYGVVTADRWPALQAEVLQVLHWAEQQFPRQRGALDEGAAWDFDISLGDSTGRDLRAVVQGQPLALQHAALPATGTVTLTLTLTGRAAFADALLQAFDLE